jgi:hypothetical protein
VGNDLEEVEKYRVPKKSLLSGEVSTNIFPMSIDDLEQ